MPTTALNPTKLTEVSTDMEAAMIVAAIEEQGIEAHITGEFTSQFRAESLGNVNILVSEADLARAQKVLSDFGKPEDVDSIEEEGYSGLTFRSFCRKTVIVGLVVLALMYLADFLMWLKLL